MTNLQHNRVTGAPGIDDPSPGRVSRHLVHKSNDAEILLAKVLDVTDRVATIALRWPDNHELFEAGASTGPDSGLVIESVRQACLLTCHEQIGLPLDHQIVLRELTFRRVGGDNGHSENLPDTPSPPAVVRIRIDTQPTGTRRRTELYSEAWVTTSGGYRARVTMRGFALDPAFYARLRPATTTRPTPQARDRAGPGTRPQPQLVGRRRAQDVVIARTQDGVPPRWWLDADPNHQTFFDHDSDHVQGILLIEAIQQVGRHTITRSATPSDGSAGHGIALAALDMSFTGFAELGPPLWFAAEALAAPQPVVDVIASQTGQDVVRAQLSFAQSGSDAPLQTWS
jgi:2-oxo-3-(phosphooxy)propyl 3-oxoalkanoate synthase